VEAGLSAGQGVPVDFEPAAPEDVEALVALRIAAMRASLERIGRFDPQRARDRFLSNWSADHTRHLVTGGERVGFVVVRPVADHLLLDHLYVHPGHQRRGIGGTALEAVLQSADAAAMAVRVVALRESDANGFYVRHGFRLVQEADWDNHYVRRPASPR